MPAAIPFLIVAGSAVSAIGAYQQGQAARKAAEYNAAVQRQNAGVHRSQSQAQAAQVQREIILRTGSIRANQGASGGDQSGSVLDVLGDVAAQGEMERQDVLYRGELAARGAENTARLDIMGGKAATRASYMAAGSELLSGAAGGLTARSQTRTLTPAGGI